MGTILAFILGAGFGAVGITLWALGEAKRQDKPYRSETMAKSIKRKQMNQKAGRGRN